MDSLHFHGPFKFIQGPQYVGDQDIANHEGIYIWTIKDEVNDINYIHYIGEAKGSRPRYDGEATGVVHRQGQHLTKILGLDYRIYDPDRAREGICEMIWTGMWKDKSNQNMARVLEAYDGVKDKLWEYISLINIYVAPTDLSDRVRKHLEGCIAWNYRRNHPELQVFYPNDNKTQRYDIQLSNPIAVTADEKIDGLIAELV